MSFKRHELNEALFGMEILDGRIKHGYLTALYRCEGQERSDRSEVR